MKVAVIIPVGPGHGRLFLHAAGSVRAAWERSRGPFDLLEAAVVDDLHGLLGRSRARNIGLEEHPADWHFLLDADDEMMPDAFNLIDLNSPATFGAVCLNGLVSRRNVFPCASADLFTHGARGTLSMGCFLRGDLGLRFDESLDVGEDFDFYMRLPGFTKRKEPLVDIGYNHPSAGGPRGYERISWVEACDRIVQRYQPHDRASRAP